MSTSVARSQDLTELAKQSFADNGLVPAPALVQSMAKTLTRLVDVAPLPTATAISHADMLRRCAHV